jgi:hypothetical protein
MVIYPFLDWSLFSTNHSKKHWFTCLTRTTFWTLLECSGPSTFFSFSYPPERSRYCTDFSTYINHQKSNSMSSITDIVPPGVVTGDNLVKLLEHARDNGYAIPAVNCTRYD